MGMKPFTPNEKSARNAPGISLCSFGTIVASKTLPLFAWVVLIQTKTIPFSSGAISFIVGGGLGGLIDPVIGIPLIVGTLPLIVPSPT